ncbi:glycerophosphodiester phosphodiesterase family protein [Sphingobacterium sp. KU25419]|nr:glycerophosphodiester phosphodiesterase family protein [Sphingobacterium sp. KU25419]
MGHAIRIFLIASCLLFSTVYAQSVRLLAELGKKDIHIAAHRGVHTQYPENSIPAILEAISLGVSIVEIDVRSTKDGVLLLMHDATVDRTTTGKGAVSNLNYADIQELICARHLMVLLLHIRFLLCRKCFVSVRVKL